MEQWQKGRINKNRANLIEITTCTEIFLTFFQERDILCQADIDELNGRCFTDHGKISKLYDILQTRTGAYDVLLNALKFTRQTGALKLLDEYKHNSLNTQSFYWVVLDKETKIENFNNKSNHWSRYLKYAVYAGVIVSCGYVSVRFIKGKIGLPDYQRKISDKVYPSSNMWAYTFNRGAELGIIVGNLVPTSHESNKIQSLSSGTDGIQKVILVGQEAATQTEASDLKQSLSTACSHCGITSKIADTVVASVTETGKRQLDLSINCQDVIRANSIAKRIKVCTLGGIGSFITILGTVGCVAPSALIVPAAMLKIFNGNSFALRFAAYAVTPAFAGPAILVGSLAMAGSFAKLMDLF